MPSAVNPALLIDRAAWPPDFARPTAPTPVPAPRLLAWNADLAERLGWPARPSALASLWFGGNVPPPGAEPVATAYAGHQFGVFVPQLGDGRALLLGDVLAPDGARFEIQLKGAGRTPFSRTGDGRAALGPVLREYLVGEGMHALGIPSTRALAVVLSGQQVLREQPLPGAVLTRVAASHVRVGSFQYYAARGDLASVRQLADWTIRRHYPELADGDAPYLELLRAVARRQAELVAAWMHVGFVHGVMNTDNMAVSGETIDYGPCAFLDEYHPGKVFSSIDRGGRYAYGAQPGIAQWNLARLAESLLPLLDADEEKALAQARQVMEDFVGWYGEAWRAGGRRKLGLATAEDGDEELAHAFLDALQEVEADYTLAFRALSHLPDGRPWFEDLPALPKTPAMDAWLRRWRERLAREARAPEDVAAGMRATNPAVIPRNHQVEAAITAAYRGEPDVFEALLAAVRRPFDDGEAQRPWMRPPTVGERVLQTFCGT
ncbi:protein adenylyltransferase SelO [Arenimonas fontis]|nr:YdiU family protein [Arenimonas fontis]